MKICDVIDSIIYWLIPIIIIVLEIIGIALVVLVPFVLGVGGICFIIWFFFQCLGCVM